MVEYYNQRASEYEEIYQRNDPIRQAELSQIATLLRETFANRRVLEVACGTGFWSKIVAEVAESLVASDASSAMMELARRKFPPNAPVRFEPCDAYRLGGVSGEFDAGLANFWLSHVPRARLQEFLTQFHRRLEPGAVVFMADNMNVPGLGGELVHLPGAEDTCKIRTLNDGSVHQIIKNYYSETELSEILHDHSAELQIHCGSAYWWVRYRTHLQSQDRKA